MSTRTKEHIDTGVRHIECGGKYHAYVIEPYGFSYLRCGRCAHFLGGTKTIEQVQRLVRRFNGKPRRLW